MASLAQMGVALIEAVLFANSLFFRAFVNSARATDDKSIWMNPFGVCYSRWSLQLLCQEACEYKCDPSVPQGQGLVSLLQMFHAVLRTSGIA